MMKYMLLMSMAIITAIVLGSIAEILLDGSGGIVAFACSFVLTGQVMKVILNK